MNIATKAGYSFDYLIEKHTCMDELCSDEQNIITIVANLPWDGASEQQLLMRAIGTDGRPKPKNSHPKHEGHM